MVDAIDKLVQDSLRDIGLCTELKALYELKVGILGKSGTLTAQLRGLRDLSGDERSTVGKYLNEARAEIEKSFDTAEYALKIKETARKLESERVDITLPSNSQKVGALHPLTQVRDSIIDFFVSLGFLVVDTPEIETEHYNFEALNIPSDHPARDSQDTFFVGGGVLLRSQTSSGQIRVMEKSSPPIKIISPGRVYRADEPDATHSPMFHQLEGLVVDKSVTMCDLKGILDKLSRHLFGSNTKTRFRQSYFPFTEPSVEVDASCMGCGGGGCRVCKGTGWIEILGAGMVNRKVLAGCNINPDEYKGFAFGLGLDRITTILYGITDLRVMFENDMRFLESMR